MKKVRVGIIGQGRSGRDIHGAHLIQDKERYEIVAATDPLADRRARAEQEYGCQTYADHRELIARKDLDLVVNASPSHLHVPYTLEVLAAGYHCLCEKPLAKRAADVDRLIDASKRSGRLLAIYQQSRFAPFFEQIVRVLESGVLGRIIQISVAYNGFARRWDWQTLQEFNGGNLLNTGPHPLDQALQLFGDGMPTVVCHMDRVNTWGDAEDYVKIILSAEGHPIVDLEISSCCAYPSFTYNIQGSRGGLKASMTEMEWKYFVPAEAPQQMLVREPLRQADGTPSYCAETLPWRTEKWSVSDGQKNLFATISAAFYGMLYESLVHGAPLKITPQQVRRQIAVIEECHRQNPRIYSHGC